MKYLSNSLTKCQDLYVKKLENTDKENKDDLNKWENTLCLWIWSLSIVKMSFLNWSTDSLHHQLKTLARKKTKTKTLASYFVVIDRVVLKFTWEEEDLE